MSKTTVETKRINSAIEYTDALIDKCSKLNVIRVDLGYKKPYSDEITFDMAKADLNRMVNNRRGKPSVFDNLVGYMCKKEYTEAKGMHFHPMFFFDGQKVLNDVMKAEQIGEYWVDNITKGNGSYHNCNRNKYKNNGVGMLEHNDSIKRANLDKAVSYLCKDDHQDIQPVKSNERDRAFTRGTLPKSKSNAGRPRKG